MHLDWHFTQAQVLWILTFAAQLVLLVVLLGRDRARRFPWFTAAIAAMALRLLTSRELFGRVPDITFTAVLIVFADVVAVLGLLVVAELARQAFAGARRSQVLINATGLLMVAAAVLSMWGAWPSWKTLTAGSQLAMLDFLQLFGQKAELLLDVLNLELGLMVILFGRRYNAPWKSHVQRIVLGLFAGSIVRLAAAQIWEHVAKTASPHSRAEAQPILDFHDRLFNASGTVHVLILLWWIACLWKDEAGAGGKRPSVPKFPPEVPAEAEAPAEPASE